MLLPIKSSMLIKQASGNIVVHVYGFVDVNVDVKYPERQDARMRQSNFATMFLVISSRFVKDKVKLIIVIKSVMML